MTDTRTPTTSNDFDDVINTAMSRRKLLIGSGIAAAAFLSPQVAGTVAANPGKGNGVGNGNGKGLASNFTPDIMDFDSVGKTDADTVTVPDGYSVQVLYSWGDPIDGSNAPFKGPKITFEEQLAASGQSHDGMHFFPIGNSGKRGLLVLNHEITETDFLFFGDQTPWDADKSAKSMAAQGVSVIEIKEKRGQWEVVKSNFSRRITTLTPMEITGPAAGDPLMRTSADPGGRMVFGTANNCANGYTPWGTYLTCEENFNAYFGIAGNDSRTPDQTILHRAYGLGSAGFGPPLYKSETRFDLALEPNESNRFGWVVEIDPFDPNSTPKKRTALGRCKHENAEVVVAPDGRVVVYTGDDERNQHLYKFVSEYTIDEADDRGVSPLDSGVLYAARFDNGGSDGIDYVGTGQWLALTPETTGFGTLAEVLVNTRGAADKVGATNMDRPEWVAADPTNPGTVYCTLTNSNLRDRSADSVDDANPRTANPNGHIIRWVEAGNDVTATTFTFDIFLLAGDPGDVAQSATDRTAAVTPNIPAFTDPDGLWFDGGGNLFIQTDGGQPTGLNNQMLVASTNGSHTKPDFTIKRMLVGPVGCEVTGITQSPDGRSLFVNIQHPGEDLLSGETKDFSDWPDRGGELPRSSTIVLRRDDGGAVSVPR